MAASKAYYTTSTLSKYANMYSSAQVTAKFAATLQAHVNTILKNISTYRMIAYYSKVPWQLVACLHMRESTLNFTRHLHEGSPLTGRTRFVPIGYPRKGPANGKVYSFVESAVDALVTVKELHKWTDWSVAGMLYIAELYNGAGYIKNNRSNPYLWSGTQHYTGGKYVRDGVYSSSAIDGQLGVAVLLKKLLEYV